MHGELLLNLLLRERSFELRHCVSAGLGQFATIGCREHGDDSRVYIHWNILVQLSYC
jgi:hypothetical protein